MNDTPTPETDAACELIYASGVAVIPLADHARKLERALDAQIALNESLTAANIKLLERLEQAQAEAEAMRDQIVPHHTTHIFPWE